MEHKIICGDCLEHLKDIKDKSIDAIVTDPPYGVSFMNKAWDKAVPHVEVWQECLRVLKPGAFLFCMSLPRQDVLSRMIVNIEDAGFDVAFPSIYHTFASGFPKAANISKIAERRKLMLSESKALEGAYAGYGPKPCVEVVIVAMRPLDEKTYVAQALKNGKGCTWLDAGRIPYDTSDIPSGGYGGMQIGIGKPSEHQEYSESNNANTKGRFAPHLLVEDDVLNNGKITKSRGGNYDWEKSHNTNPTNIMNNIKSGRHYEDSGSFSCYFSLDTWWDARIAELPEEIQKTFPFLIVPKASKSEKNKGLKGITNNHATVKSIKLISYLLTIASREGDTVLDPYVGSGTTLVAAEMLNRNAIGIDISAEYCNIVYHRLLSEVNQLKIDRDSTIEKIGF